MKAAVLDEDFVGVGAGDDDSGQINSRAFALQRLGIRDGLRRGRIQMDPVVGHELEVGAVAGHGKDEIVLDGDFAFRRLQHHFVRPDLFDDRVEVALDFAALDAVFNVRLDPIFHVVRDAASRDGPW